MDELEDWLVMDTAEQLTEELSYRSGEREREPIMSFILCDVFCMEGSCSQNTNFNFYKAMLIIYIYIYIYISDGYIYITHSTIIIVYSR